MEARSVMEGQIQLGYFDNDMFNVKEQQQYGWEASSLSLLTFQFS